MKTRDRLRELARSYPLLADGALAALVLVLSLPPFTSLLTSHQALAVVLIAAMACPLTWRRRARRSEQLTLPPGADGLTAREREILIEVAAGLSTRRSPPSWCWLRRPSRPTWAGC